MSSRDLHGAVFRLGPSVGPRQRANLITLLRRLPALAGAPILLELVSGLRDRYGAVHGGSFLRERRIALDCSQREFTRILTHEIFHFVWLRGGNSRRHSYEKVLIAELRTGVRGELGWSADWRKQLLQPMDWRKRTRRWREYCCESFCDTSAWIYSGLSEHAEFTLASRFRNNRRSCCALFLRNGRLPV